MSSSSSHLTFPTPTPPDAELAAVPSAKPRPLSRNRLYIGNLHPTVDEYTLLRVFSKYGKVTNLDFLFHKSGPCKGKPRGFAFIEYGDQQDALRALHTAHDKLLRGRKLVVTFAHQAPSDGDSSKDNPTRLQNKFYDRGRSTALSLLKSGTSSKADRTQDKIVALEAKLQQLERSRTAGPTLSAERAGTPPHPSLPPKPPPFIPSPSTSQSASTKRFNSHKVTSSSAASISTALPALPISSHKVKAKESLVLQHAQTTTTKERSSRLTQGFASSSLVGVKIKAKERTEQKKRDQDAAVADPVEYSGE